MSTKTMFENAVAKWSNLIASGRVACNKSLHFTGSHFNVSFRQNYRRSIGKLSMALLLRSFIIVLIIPASYGNSACQLGKEYKYDLSPLSGYVWNSTVTNESDAFEFRFSLCEPLQEPFICKNSSVCRVRIADGFGTNVGNFSANVKTEETVDGFWAIFFGDSNCPDGGFYKTIVKFECGKNLGLPKLLNWKGCFASFLWKTSAACLELKPKKEVPCYQFDSHGNLYDLTPLIKTTGSYSIKLSSAPVNFYINICAGSAPDGTSPSSRACSPGAGACRVTGSEVINFGDVETPVTLTSGGDLQIVYRNKAGPKPAGCTENPRTTITFVCPIAGGGKDPTVVSNSNCDLQVEWMTEYACPLLKIQSRDCRLYDEVHGLHVDLSAMKAVADPFSAKGNISGTNFDFYLSVCGGFAQNFMCSNMSGPDVMACRKSSIDDPGIIIGQKNKTVLSYSNGELVIVSESDNALLCPESPNATAITTVIHLICSTRAVNQGVGVPVFLRKEDCTYFFEWHSKAACVEMFLGRHCNIVNDSKIIDLSSLKRGPGEIPWEVESASDFERMRTNISRIFINVCGAVRRTTATINCPIGAAVCVQNKDGTYENFGQFVRLPQIDPNSGNVQITYTNGGEPCSSNASLNRTTKITFICWPGMNRSPREVHISPDGCFLDIEWITTAACVQESVQGNNCKVEVPQLGFSFDLTPLKRDFYYLMSAGNYEYFLNLCGPLKGSDVPCITGNTDVSACQVLKSDRTKFWSLGRSAEIISYDSGLLNVTYTGGSPDLNSPSALRKTEILFECDHSAGNGEPTFMKQNGNAYRFLWRTSHACPLHPIQCVVTDNSGIQYDLSSLSRGYGEKNWIVDGNTRVDLSYDRYYINVCNAIGNSAPWGCDPSAGACTTRVANNSEIVTTANMGKPVLPPYVENGKVMLKLVNGSQCPQNPSKNHTTFIYFLCSDEPEGQDAGIALLRNLPASCITMFLWITKAACHISKLPASTVNKDACVIFNPFAAFTFDLSPLNVALHANSSLEEIEGFFINVCGTVMPTSCKLSPDAISSGLSACGYSTKGDQVGLVIGQADTRTVEALTEDIISVKYNASKFKTGYEVEVLLKCRRNMEGNSLRFIRQEMLSFVFELETTVVCPPRPVDCFVHDTYKNLQYDLSPLARRTSNWVFSDGRLGLQDTRYIINVCRTVNGQGSHPACYGRNIGACMVDKVNGNSAIIGHVQSQPRVNEDGSITLRYLHGAPCGSGDFFYSMRINFLCAGEEGEPEFVDETPECEIVVNWKTTAACPFKQYVGNDCKVFDPKSGTTYDFSGLKNLAGYNVVAARKNFTLNLCGPLANGCHGLSTSGVCVTSKNTEISAGNYSDKITFKRGVFTLHYDAEPDRGSLITLTCSHETNGYEGPSYVESSEDGPFIFLWPTSYACSYYKTADCRIGGPDGKLYDLSGLTLKDRNHVLVSKDKKVKYSINVCHSVILGEDLHCPFGAGICAVNASEANSEKQYLNLGEVNNGPEVEDGVLKLNYRMGGPCTRRDGSSSRFRTTIWFYCHTRENEPRLISEDDCEFRFDWFTSAACPINIADNVGADCSVLDPLTGFRFNLSGLRNSTDPYRVDFDGDEFLLNVCGPVMCEPSGSTSSLAGSCHISHVGKAEEYLNLGVANSQLHRRGDIIFLNYSNGEVCHNGAMTRNTLITFMCGEEGSGNGHPYFVGSSNNCTYFFNWKTELACEKKLNCLVEYNSEIFDLKQLSQKSEQPVAISKLDSGSIFLINVCNPLVTGPRVNCPPGAAVCRLQLGSQIGLNLGHAVKEPSADSQGHVTIEYAHGSPCPDNLRLNMSSKIIFICQEGSDKGIPELIEVTDDCVYMFQWRTYVVCPKPRVIQNNNCTHFDATTRFTFDLNPLGDHDTVVASHGSNFTLNPCGSKGDSVAARSWVGGPNGESWGSAINSRFWYDGSALQVIYPDGDICAEKERKSTTVWFVCEAGVGVGQPELITVSDCKATFTWRTEHACHPSSSSCVAFLASSYSFVDLRYLSATNHSWVVSDSEGNAYLLNVCNGILPSEASGLCTISSSVCMKSAVNGKIYELGNIATQRITSEDDAVTVRYTSRSDICGPQMFTQASITFVCGTQLGVPYLVSKTNTTSMCSFYFLWKTRVACGSKSFRQVYSSDGFIEDPEFGWAANLTDIFNATVHAVENRGTALITYTINVNGLHFVMENPCNGSAICFNNSLYPTVCKSIGIATSRKLYVQNGELIVDFTTKEACAKNLNKNVSSSVSFSCSSKAGQGNPEFVYESHDCHYTFIWETSRMCSTFRGFSNVTYQVANSTRISVGAVIGFVILAIVLCAITVILAQRNARMYVKDRVRSLFKNQSSPSSSLHYSVLLNSEETSLLTRAAAHRDIVLQRLPANESDSVIA